jgi:hypothetical protein
MNSSPQSRNNAGFTLAEFAICLVIAGLLIGGVLQGQRFLEDARTNATVAKVKSLSSSLATFSQLFSVYPGDMPHASRRLPGCNANCDPAQAGAGDGIVGNPVWSATWASQTPSGMNTPPSTVGDETVLFWLHLAKANLITGISDQAITTGRLGWALPIPLPL